MCEILVWIFAEKPADNIVDANMSVLRERMEQVRKRERVISTRNSDHGWNYKQYENMCKRKRSDAMVSEFAEVMGLACGAIGLVFFSGSFCICLLSLLFHMYIK